MPSQSQHRVDGPFLTKSQLGLLIGGLLTTAIGQSFIFAILPPLGRDVGFNELQINTLISSSALIFSLGSAIWGRISDRVGRKPVILAGLIGYAIGNLCFTLVFDAAMRGWIAGFPLFAAALAVRCSQAAVMSATNPAAGAYAADYSQPQHRTKALAKLGTSSSLGMIFGPIMAGALAGLGLLFPLYTATGLAIVAVIIIARYLPNDRSATGRQKDQKKLAAFDKRIRGLLMCSVCAFTGFAGIQQTLAFRLQDMLLLTGTETAQHMGICLMVAALMTLTMQLTIAQRFQGAPVILLRIGVVLMLLGSLIVAAASSFAPILVGMASMGAGLGLAAPGIAAGASLAVTPQEQGSVAGLVTAFPAAGFVLGPVICGSLYTYEPTMSALSASVMLLVALFIALRGSRLRRRNRL
jgi:MFS family permease